MSLTIKQYSDFYIHIREDGFFNATEMCKAFNKKINDYLRLENTKSFLEALQTDTGFTASLVDSRKGGSDNQGTWVHRLVAIDLARWLSPSFHVQVIRWADEIMSKGNTVLSISSEDGYTSRIIDFFSRTPNPMRKEVIVRNANGNCRRTRRLDMKEVFTNNYYEVKLHRIDIPDLVQIIADRSYLEILDNLHGEDYHLFFTSPKGITKEAMALINHNSKISFKHTHELLLSGAVSMLEDTPFGTAQLLNHILPLYKDILPDGWKESLNDSNEELIYIKDLPLGVSKNGKRFRGRFKKDGRDIEVGTFDNPIQAGLAVRRKKIEMFGNYTVPSNIKHYRTQSALSTNS